MKWIVLEENPKPDQYIAIIAVDDERFVEVEKKDLCSVFRTNEEALIRARELRSFFNVRNIRIFFIDGHSSIV
ncbi:MAG: hypothetical protein U5K54_18370 [Cytophagales bacterium]|nr:hypothetical protein [Cytophagales bacterium]